MEAEIYLERSQLQIYSTLRPQIRDISRLKVRREEGIEKGAVCGGHLTFAKPNYIKIIPNRITTTFDGVAYLISIIFSFIKEFNQQILASFLKYIRINNLINYITYK